jgi:hypothetical protein
VFRVFPDPLDLLRGKLLHDGLRRRPPETGEEKRSGSGTGYVYGRFTPVAMLYCPEGLKIMAYREYTTARSEEKAKQ